VPAYFPENNNPLPLDTEVRSLQKINDLLKGGVGISIEGSGLSSDAFGRLRTSNPTTLFDSSHRYADNNLWAISTATGGSSSFNANQGLVELSVTSASGSQVLRETTKVFSYQPGKSLLVMNTFVMAPAKTNLRQRVGYFGTDNGIYLELNNSTLSFVERSLATGTSTTVNQANWNGDKLDGTGTSGLTLDIAKAQILWADIEWLGLGTVRVGFVINGQFITCHSFHHANIITSTYITTASLPLRYEITNTGATSGSSTLKQVCSTVISEGGYELRGLQQAIGVPVGTARTLGATNVQTPIVSLRLKTTRLDAIVILTAISVLGTGNGTNFNWNVTASGTVSGGTWVDAGVNSSVEYNLGGTISGGRVLASGYLNSSNQGASAVDILKEALFKFQLERDSFTSTPFNLSLTAAGGSNGQGIFGSVDWEEISR
jgi:hypothetical protein